MSRTTRKTRPSRKREQSPSDSDLEIINSNTQYQNESDIEIIDSNIHNNQNYNTNTSSNQDESVFYTNAPISLIEMHDFQEFDMHDFQEYKNEKMENDLIDELPTRMLKEKDAMIKEKCLICLEKYEMGNQLLTLPCIHQFHVKCIEQWFKTRTNCPTCKLDI